MDGIGGGIREGRVLDYGGGGGLLVFRDIRESGRLC